MRGSIARVGLNCPNNVYIVRYSILTMKYTQIFHESYSDNYNLPFL